MLNLQENPTMARGRPRKPGRRKPSGDLRPQKLGAPPEQERRRAWLAQGGDPAKTSTPLDVLLVNGQIDPEEALAGQRFAWWHWRVFGRGSTSAGRYEERLDHEEELAAGDYDDPESEANKAQARIEGKLQRATAALDAVSRQTRDSIVSLCVYERFPRFLLPVMPVARDVAEAQRIKRGLETLAETLGTKRTRRLEMEAA